MGVGSRGKYESGYIHLLASYLLSPEQNVFPLE
jgi:hypothetical protein